MIFANFLAWWYGAGWRGQASRIAATLVKVEDFFSIDLLLKTLFSPFRQISADTRGKGLSAAFQAFLDRLFSRIIGFVVRSFMILFGLISLIFVLVVSLVRLILWPVFPFAPLFAIILMNLVGAPWKII